jgi:hypothetical protein
MEKRINLHGDEKNGNNKFRYPVKRDIFLMEACDEYQQ